MFKTPLSQSQRQESPYRWVILAMVTVSGFILMGFPTTGLSAMFSEIADSLGLDLIEIGMIWGIGTAMGIFTSLLGGAFIDYFGTRRTLIVLCLATGITGALRGFAVDFWSLFLFSFLFGMVQPILPMNFVKLNREWFASRPAWFRRRCDVGWLCHRLDARFAFERDCAIADAGRLAGGVDLPGRLRHFDCLLLGDRAPAV